jgi:RNA polymerase sigma factor (sigma-70 family)
MLLYVLLDRTTVHTAAVLFLSNGGQTTGWFCFSGFRR